jgi:hypothetical protein
MLVTLTVLCASFLAKTLQGDIVVRQGDMGSEMYFVGEGALEVRPQAAAAATVLILCAMCPDVPALSHCFLSVLCPHMSGSTRTVGAP